MAPRKTTKPTARKTKEAPVIKHQKPVFRTGTWVTLLLLAALIGFAYYLNNKTDDTEAIPTPASIEETFVFGEEDGSLVSIEIKPLDGEAVKAVRNEENIWALELPIEAEADQGLVEAAASQVAALNIVSEVDADPSILGLDQPAYLIMLEFADGTKHTLEVGDNTPTNSGYYVRVDNKKIMILTLNGIDSLTTLAQFPPYLNPPLPTTPTP